MNVDNQMGQSELSCPVGTGTRRCPYRVGQRFTVRQRIKISPVGPESANKNAVPGSIGARSSEPTRNSVARLPNKSVAMTSMGERIGLLENPGIIRTEIPQISKVINPTAKLWRITSILTGSVPVNNAAMPSITSSTPPNDAQR